MASRVRRVFQTDPLFDLLQGDLVPDGGKIAPDALQLRLDLGVLLQISGAGAHAVVGQD